MCIFIFLCFFFSTYVPVHIFVFPNVVETNRSQLSGNVVSSQNVDNTRKTIGPFNCIKKTVLKSKVLRRTSSCRDPVLDREAVFYFKYQFKNSQHLIRFIFDLCSQATSILVWSRAKINHVAGIVLCYCLLTGMESFFLAGRLLNVNVLVHE